VCVCVFCVCVGVYNVYNGFTYIVIQRMFTCLVVQTRYLQHCERSASFFVSMRPPMGLGGEFLNVPTLTRLPRSAVKSQDGYKHQTPLDFTFYILRPKAKYFTGIHPVILFFFLKIVTRTNSYHGKHLLFAKQGSSCIP